MSEFDIKRKLINRSQQFSQFDVNLSPSGQTDYLRKNLNELN